MVTFAKTSKIQRVRAVALVRQPVGEACFVFVAAVALLCVLSSTALGSLNGDLGKQLESCNQIFTKNMREVKDQADTDDLEARLSEKCEENLREEDAVTKLRAKINLDAFPPARKQAVKRLQEDLLDMTQASSDSRRGAPRMPALGSCEIGAIGTAWAYKLFEAKRSQMCQETIAVLNNNYRCYERQDIKNCEASINAMKTQIENDYVNNTRLVHKLKEYLAELKKQNDAAVTAYTRDLNAFKGPGLRVIDNMNDANVNPANGGVSDKDAYLRRLIDGPPDVLNTLHLRTFDPRPQQWGKIIKEQKELSDVSGLFAQKLDAYLEEHSRFKGALAKSGWENYKEPDTSSWTEKVGTVAPVAGAAASGITGITGGAAAPNAAAAALPLAAAAGAGAALSSKNASSSSLGSAFEAGAMGMSKGGPEAATVQATNLAPNAPAAGVPGVLPTLHAESPTGKKEKDSGDERAPASSGGTFIPGGLAGSGSSMTAGKSGGGKTTATTGGSGGAEGLLDAFSDDLKPATTAAPAKKSNDGMTEVTNMLGQMKNLFNFDDHGAQPAADPNAFEPVASSDGGPAAAGGDEFNDGFTYGGNYDTAAEGGASHEDEALSSLGPGASKEEIAQAAQFGSIGTPLFQRVHRRHRVAIEKGLVVQEFGRLPQ